MLSVILLTFLVWVCTAQTVEIGNVYTLKRTDNYTCYSLFIHEDYLFSSCTNQEFVPFPNYEHELQIWDCSTSPCTEASVLSTGFNNQVPVRYFDYERKNAGEFRFLITDYMDLIKIYECTVSKSENRDALACGQIFETIYMNSGPYYELLITGFSSDSVGNARLVGFVGYTAVVYYDCFIATNECFEIDYHEVKNIIPGGVMAYRVKTLHGGETIFIGDTGHTSARGSIFKLNCLPISETLGVDSANCSVISSSMIDNANPASLLGSELIVKTVSNSENITILAGAVGWTNAFGYKSGAVASFFCSPQFGADVPCSRAETNIHHGPTANCYADTCYYGVQSTIGVSSNGRKFVIGAPQANGGAGYVDLFSCNELQMVLCSHAGSFNPAQPPRSDFFGIAPVMNTAGTMMAVTATRYENIYEGLNHMWLADLTFNDTSIPQYVPAKPSHQVRQSDDEEYIYSNMAQIIAVFEKLDELAPKTFTTSLVSIFKNSYYQTEF